jgi:DNA (cytosine-5)-methyltransferase 1
MEAASVAWHPLGWTPVGFSEIEPFPCAILKHRFPNTPNYGSLTEYQSWPLEPGAIDLLVGGTPCQSFSVAGLRKGLADPRGNLALTFLGLADKLKPRWIVWENVPGVLSSGGGRDFGSFLGALVELGYGFAYRVLDAQHFGVPQRRRRVFVVACLGDWRAPAEVLSLREGLRGYLETGNKKRKSVAGDAGASAQAGRKWPADVACTLNASFGDKQGLEDQHALGGGSLFVPAPICMSSGQANAAIAEDKAHTLNATHETQTIATPIVIDRAAFNQGENAQYEPHIGESEVMDSLVARGPHAVGVPFRKSKRACSTTDNETWVPADASNTLNNFDLGDTRTTHAVVQPVATQGTIIGRGEKAGPQGTGATEGGPMFTLTKTDIHAVAQPVAWTQNQREEVRLLGDKVGAIALPGTHQTNYIAEPVHQMPGSVAPTIGASGPPYSRTGNERVEAEALAVTVHPIIAPCITASNDPSRSPQSSEVTQQVAAVHQATMAVRRLTPVECERLQGFPDNWSRISWKGKPEEDCPDGPRYKACGNSMAVPVMRWIGERIAAVDSTLSTHA